jgi:hypothetical protein
MPDIFFSVALDKDEVIAANIAGVELRGGNEITGAAGLHHMNSTKTERLECIVTAISREKCNVLVYNVCYTLADLQQIAAMLASHNLKISGVYVPSVGRRHANLTKALYNSAQHSRWIGTAPGEIEDSYQILDENIAEIKAFGNMPVMEV